MTISLMKLPVRFRRVKLAKDVIKHLQGKDKIITAVRNSYFDLNLSWDAEYDWSYSSQVDEVVSSIGCEVCAIGALFIADVMIRDRATVHDAYGVDTMKRRLSKHFGVRALELIETAFEMVPAPGGTIDDGEIIDKAIRFGKRFESDKRRMIAIMNNIIDNDGDFIP